MRRFNGEVLDPGNGPGKKSMMDSAPAVQMAKWFYDNIKSKLFSPRTYGAKEFGEGKMAFYFGRLAGERGSVNNAAGKNFEWTFDISPKGPTGRRGGFLSIDTQQINAASKNKDARGSSSRPSRARTQESTLRFNRPVHSRRASARTSTAQISS